MRKKIIIFSVIVVALLSYAGFVFSANEKKKKDELYRQIELFSEAVAIIENEYVDEPKSKDLIYGALKGMLSSLDAHSQFMDPEAYNDLKIDTEGKFGGMGIEITIKDSLLTVITPIEDTPAWRAGIKPGDRIVKINDELTREMLLTDAVKRMRGKPGETVNLSILREKEKKILEFKITREIIKIKDIQRVEVLENKVGYIRLAEFRENTAQEFNRALEKLSKQNINALILDLRNNPGGLLDVAVKITEKFIPKGKLIVYTKARESSQNLEFKSDGKSAIVDLPLAVLINEGSASGSEIVAGCLQDYKRAIIIGTKSFGKGSVQSVIPLPDGSALRLTTSKYFTPSGKIIHGKGVIPDIVIEKPADKQEVIDGEAKEIAKDEVFEALKNKDEVKQDKENIFDYKSDEQISRALDALKAIKLYKHD